MDVHGLTRVAFVGIEEKAEIFVSEDDGHGINFLSLMDKRVPLQPIVRATVHQVLPVHA